MNMKDSRFGNLNTVGIAGKATLAASLLLAAQITGAEWLEVTKEDRIVTIDASGVVASEVESNIGVPTSDSWRLRIDTLVEEGSRVRKGQVVLRIESSSQERDIEEYEAELDEMKSQVEATRERNLQDIESEKLERADLKSQAIKANRRAALPDGVLPGIEYKKLVENKRLANTLYQRGLVRQKMSEVARTLQLETLQRKITRMETRLDERKRELASFTVRAPNPGLAIIGVDWQGEKLDAGSRVGPGMPVVTVVDDTKILVRGDVREQWAAKLAVGQRVIIETDALVGAKLKGSIDSVGNTVRRKSHRSPTMVRDFTVKFDQDYSSVLSLGVSVQVTIEVDMLENAIAVPKGALIYRDGKPGVQTPGEWKPVELGSASEGYFIVLNGLEEGERVRL